MSCALTTCPGCSGAATPEMRLGVEQHRAGDDRRHLVDAELPERGLRRGLHVALRIAAVIGGAAGGKLALAVPGVRQHREMPQCVHLRALLAGIAAHHLVGVEGMTGAGNAHRGLGVLAQRHRERRLRHGVRAQERQLVGFRGGIGEIGRAALPRGGAERIRHPDLVARRPGRTVLRLRGKRAGRTAPTVIPTGRRTRSMMPSLRRRPARATAPSPITAADCRACAPASPVFSPAASRAHGRRGRGWRAA